LLCAPLAAEWPEARPPPTSQYHGIKVVRHKLHSSFADLGLMISE
jgi:hypothetical protein